MLALDPKLAHKALETGGRCQQAGVSKTKMPTLLRLLVFCAVIAGLIYGGMFALVHYVDPREREITVRVPADRLRLEP